MSFKSFLSNAVSGVSRFLGRAGSIGRNLGTATSGIGRALGTVSPAVAAGLRAYGDSASDPAAQYLAGVAARGVEMLPRGLQRVGQTLERVGGYGVGANTIIDGAQRYLSR